MPSIINATTTNGLSTSADNSGSLQLATNNGTTAVTIDTSQNVGIGTTTPAQKLDVNGTAAIKSVVVADGANGTLQLGSASTYSIVGGVDNEGIRYNVPTGANHLFRTNATERMRIDSSGNVLVGTTNAADSSGTGCKIIQIANGVSPSVALVGSASTNGGGTGFQMYSTGASAYRFYVGFGGTIFATSTSITGISDQRVKENIVDLDDGLDSVLALKPRKFDWKEGKGKDIKGDRGFIAQEFETVFPDMIEEWKDPAPEGEEPYKAVNANLIPTLVKAIQELNAKVEAQAVRIAELEGAK